MALNFKCPDVYGPCIIINNIIILTGCVAGASRTVHPQHGRGSNCGKDPGSWDGTTRIVSRPFPVKSAFCVVNSAYLSGGFS